ncbi:hypothetical protein JCM10449v2_000267 [Rhodotorula kratochvilovae]
MSAHPPDPPARAVAPTGASDDLVDDGPLFRAHLASLERRAYNLRQALKKLLRALEASLTALAANAQAHAALDDALEDLSAASLTSQSDVLGGLYERELRARRDRAREDARAEVERGKELVERVKGAIDRIKAVEDRRKAFDAESKRYYDELAKYLARGESDPTKIATLDAKQADRAASFRQLRIDFFSFLEGLVESEERAVASWLRAWADLRSGDDDGDERSPDAHRSASLAALEGAQHAGAHAARARPRPSAGSSTTGESWCQVGGLPTYLADAVSGPDDPAPLPLPLASDDGHSAAPSGSGLSALSRTTTGGLEPASSTPSSAQSRRRRSSLPVFGLGASAEKEKEPTAPAGKRDRLKGFFRTAQHSISSALPTSASSAALADLGRRPSPPPPSVPPTLAPAPAPAPTASLAPPRAAPATAQPRKKEGFLYATEAGQKHTTAGDRGEKYHRYWVTLSEGQLVEYARWTDAMQVHGTPINLLRASARISRQAGDRRFVFEVLTPELRRVYQAGSEKECQEWVAAIQKSVESLLNGTSSVRHFDASRLKGSLAPSPLGELGSSPSSLPNAAPDPPTSPRSRFPPFLSRRASAGQHSRKTSQTGKKDKRRSFQHLHSHASTPPVPSFSFDADRALPDRSFFDASSRRGMFAFSDSDAPPPPAGAARPRLGIPYASGGLGGPASRSTPDLHRAPSPGGSFPSSRETIDEAGGDVDAAYAPGLSPEERAISDAVRTWASSSASAAAAAAAAAADAAAEQAKYRNASRIAAVAARAAPEWDNARCADCRAPEPRWASWSLGITLCIRCSGAHRSLGTHVSKVRSVELDDWSDEQLERMERVGNARSNAYFEARLPEGTVEGLTDATATSFIKDKYVEKRWAPLDDPHASPPASTIPLAPSAPYP